MPAVHIKSAKYRQGYSGCDHYLSDSDFEALVGRAYPSAKAARKAVHEVATYGDGHCPHSPIALDLVDGVGPPPRPEVLTHLPGRQEGLVVLWLLALTALFLAMLCLWYSLR
jgi:hypothetical protein